jgi:hypothetical protein
VAAVGAADRGDSRSVARGGEPVMHRGANFPSLDRGLAGPMMAGDQQQHPLAARDCLLEAAVDRGPGFVQAQPVEVQDAIRSGTSIGEFPIPGAVEGPVRNRHRWGLWRWRRCRPDRFVRSRAGVMVWCRFGRSLTARLSRQRANRRRDPRPERRFLRAERAHGRQRPSARGSRPGRSLTCRRQSPPPPLPIPRMCRSGLGP